MHISILTSLLSLQSKMKVFILILQITLINCNLNFNNTTNDIHNIINNFKIPLICNKCRASRCINFHRFVPKSVKYSDKTVGYGGKKYNGACSRGDNVVESSNNDIKKQMLSGLLVDHEVSDDHWNKYKTVYNKTYSTPHHEMSALSTWRENLKRVAEHNRRYLAGELSYSLHLNHFGDLDAPDYFKKILKLFDTIPLFDPAEDHFKTTYRKVARRRTPRQVDWRSKGFKPRREEQFKCGACYAFAVAHALQAQLYKRHGDWSELSPQQIVDCSYKDGNMGCNGGSLRAALRYAAREGLNLETEYPYTGKKGQCHNARSSTRVRPRRWAMLPQGDEKAMERALATIGPLAVGVNASPFTFQLYRSGVYDDIFCVPWTLNHAMLLVGYTPEYWILLNWWGKQWGEDGYMRIRRGFNRCGVANMAAYVEL